MYLLSDVKTILLTFTRNRSKYLGKTITLAKKADRFRETDGQIGCEFKVAPDSLGRLYYLLRALWLSHRFKSLEVGIDGHVLTEAEIHDLWNTLSCFISTRRFKNTRNHCDNLIRPNSAAFHLSLDENNDESVYAIVIPCKRVFHELHSNTVINHETFSDVARKLYCDVCPLFNSNLYRKVTLDEYGEELKENNRLDTVKKLN